jgi:hypothetical protein
MTPQHSLAASGTMGVACPPRLLGSTRLPAVREETRRVGKEDKFVVVDEEDVGGLV